MGAAREESGVSVFTQPVKRGKAMAMAGHG